MTRPDRLASAGFVFLLLCFTCSVGLAPRTKQRVAYDAAMNPRMMANEAAMTGTVLPLLEFDLLHPRQPTKPKTTTKSSNAMAFESSHVLMAQRNLALTQRRTVGPGTRQTWIGSR